MPIAWDNAGWSLDCLQGTWYEQARYDNDFQMLEHCVVVSFTKENGKDLFNVQGIVDDKPLAFSGPINAASNGTGVLFFHSSVYKNIEKTDEMAVAVLALDVNNYAVMYDCKYDEETKKHHDYLWILSRYKTYSGVTKTFVDGLLDRSPFVDKSKLVWQDFLPKSCNR
ncbi:bilin-binding protein-like [Aricia agestis]|uniref:bilin-binding protein-like n=1 Tax=Aricia agestis TaxID=91739 RepID=UPI001C203A52|nr:bilin-binding protein-like [Aricia agestis]